MLIFLSAHTPSKRPSLCKDESVFIDECTKEQEDAVYHDCQHSLIRNGACYWCGKDEGLT